MINMNHFEKWELESDLKAAKTKNANEKSSMEFGIGIAAQLGVKKVISNDLNRNKVRKFNNSYQSNNYNDDANNSKMFDEKRIKLNNHDLVQKKSFKATTLHKNQNHCLRHNEEIDQSINELDKPTQILQKHTMKCQKNLSDIKKESKINKLNVSKGDILIKKKKPKMAIKNEELNINPNIIDAVANSSLKIDTKQINCSKKISPNFDKELSKQKSKTICPASFVLKSLTTNISTQTELPDDSKIVNPDGPFKVTFKVILQYNQYVKRPFKEMVNYKGQSLSGFFSKVVDNVKSTRRRSVESVDDKCFISLNSRFVAFLTMDLSKLELIPEEENTNESEPVRIFTLLNHEHNQFYIKNQYSIPDILITRLYPQTT